MLQSVVLIKVCCQIDAAVRRRGMRGQDEARQTPPLRLKPLIALLAEIRRTEPSELPSTLDLRSATFRLCRKGGGGFQTEKQKEPAFSQWQAKYLQPRLRGLEESKKPRTPTCRRVLLPVATNRSKTVWAPCLRAKGGLSPPFKPPLRPP